MINRRANVYCALPEELQRKNSKDAKMAISISMTLPKELEGKKASKFIDEQMEEVSKAFRKFIKKQSEKVISDV